MNKYQEALEELRKLERAYNFKNMGQVAPQVNCDVLQKLVDKVTPKKAILKEGYSPIEDCYGEWFYCPSCNVFLSDKDNLGNFCHNCGQALKWSDEE